MAAASRRLRGVRGWRPKVGVERPSAEGQCPRPEAPVREQVAALLERGVGTSFDAVEFERWRQPAVYIALDADEQPVYVGVSRNGLERVLRDHHRAAEMRGCRFLLWSMPSEAEARTLEGLLIARLQPRANVQGRHRVDAVAARLGVGRRAVYKLLTRGWEAQIVAARAAGAAR